MNYKQKETIRRDNLNLLEWHETSHINCFRLNVGNTFEHELKKFEIFYDLRKNKEDVITEARFKCGIRADVFEINAGIIWEVMHTETNQSISEKQNKLPAHIRIIKVKT